MFIKNTNNLPKDIIWLIEWKAIKLMEFYPEISRRISGMGNTEIAFMDTKEIRDKIKELKI